VYKATYVPKSSRSVFELVKWTFGNLNFEFSLLNAVRKNLVSRVPSFQSRGVFSLSRRQNIS
jgi:hypothetical protein